MALCCINPDNRRVCARARLELSIRANYLSMNFFINFYILYCSNSARLLFTRVLKFSSRAAPRVFFGSRWLARRRLTPRIVGKPLTLGEIGFALSRALKLRERVARTRHYRDRCLTRVTTSPGGEGESKGINVDFWQERIGLNGKFARLNGLQMFSGPGRQQ